MIHYSRIGSKINSVSKFMPLQLKTKVSYKYFNLYQWPRKSHSNLFIFNFSTLKKSSLYPQNIKKD